MSTGGSETGDGIGEGAAAFSPGTRIGRYVVLHTVGAGGMGVVLAAYDPQLDRKVALKLLRPRGELTHARTRLQREAQALAKLDHPAVVSVHDVGVHEEQLYLAMDLVGGHTLTRWLQATPRSWRAVIDVFVEAGRGLAAAHDAGLVHRDFKPDNVMIDEGASRRVRVMDFGLARAESSAATQSHGETEPAPGLGPLTVTGAVIGTPAYMPLEQFDADADEVDARSDQFAFCVALYEALYGERPFAANDLAELLAALADERVREAPPGSRVPAWLRRAVVRGLAGDPDRRWPSMHALLGALLDDPAPRRRRWLALGLGSSLLAGLIAALVLARETPSASDPCSGAAAKLAGVWDVERRAALEQALVATQLAYAPDTWQRVSTHLDTYAASWVAAHASACAATQAGEQSPELLDLRMSCLDERRVQLAALVDELATADATIVEHATEAVLELPGLERCSDADVLRAEVPPPDDPRVRAAVEQLEQRLASARAKQLAGKLEAPEAIVADVLREAEALGHAPLLAKAWHQHGLLATDLGRYDEAVVACERTLELALELRMVELAARASAQLVYVVGYKQGKHERGHAWASVSGALARASGSQLVLAEHESSLGLLTSSEGKWSDARVHHERALALRREHGDGEGEQLAIATSLGSLGSLATVQGDFDEAQRRMAEALDILIRAQGPEHPDVASTINNLGSVAAMRGDFALAREHFEAALRIWERALGPEHPDVAYSLGNLGAVAKDQGRYDEARDYLERSLAIWERALGSEHETIANSLDNLGSLALVQGHFADARDTFQRSLSLRERIQGPEHPYLAHSLTGLGRAWLGLDEPALARPLLERALLLRSGEAVPAYQRGETRFALARALLADSPGHPDTATRARARELAEQARADYVVDGEESRQVRDIDAWLAGFDR